MLTIIDSVAEKNSEFEAGFCVRDQRLGGVVSPPLMQTGNTDLLENSGGLHNKIVKKKT